MEKFLGETEQIPPMVSAIKVNGKKLYEYARAGIEVKRAPRPIVVHSFTLLSFSGEEAEVRAKVSRGTYIRTLLSDLCGEAGVIGSMSAFLREKSGIFTLENAVRLETLERLSPAERTALLLPTETLFESYPAFTLPPFFDRLITNGCTVDTAKLGLSGFPAGQRLRLYRENVFIALGEIREHDGVKGLCAVKQFPPDAD